MLQKIKNHLNDNTGSAYFEKIILIAIAFIVGGALIGLLWGAAGSDQFKEGMGNVVGNMFNW